MSSYVRLLFCINTYIILNIRHLNMPLLFTKMTPNLMTSCLTMFIPVHEWFTHSGTVLLHDGIWRAFSQQVAVPHETHLETW